MRDLSRKIVFFVPFFFLALFVSHQGLAILNWPSFNADAFTSAQDEGRPIVVVVHAEWCATCRSQEPSLNKVVSLPEYKDFVLFRIDFDTQKDVMAELNIPVRSTIIIYRGSREAGRLVAETSFDVIRDLFSFGLS